MRRPRPGQRYLNVCAFAVATALMLDAAHYPRLAAVAGVAGAVVLAAFVFLHLRSAR